MKTVTICKGLPASGKTTWAKETLVNSPANSIKRINKDDLRAMLDESCYSKGNEKFVLQVRDHLILAALDNGSHVIVDDTNLHPKHIRDITRLVKDIYGGNVQVKIKDFTDVSLEECLKRNEQRGFKVPNHVIVSMYDKFLKGTSSEESPIRPHHQGRENIIICDLDGTLSLMGDRSPYDASTCFNDEVNLPVLAVLKSYPASKIVFLSGRSNRYENETRRFLEVKCAFPDVELYMREDGDNRKDSIVKEELFMNNIADTYNVDFVLDDRNQVVDMWRRIGLTCFQVANGNF